MNKAQLVEVIVNDTQLTKDEAYLAVDAFIGASTKALKSDDSLTLVGFGSFSVTKRAARTGRNPKTGVEVKIPAKKAPKFKAGKALKEAVAGGASSVKPKAAAKVVAKAKKK